VAGSPSVKRDFNTSGKEEIKTTESIVEDEVPPAVDEDEEEYNEDEFEADSQKSGVKKGEIF